MFASRRKRAIERLSTPTAMLWRQNDSMSTPMTGRPRKCSITMVDSTICRICCRPMMETARCRVSIGSGKPYSEELAMRSVFAAMAGSSSTASVIPATFAVGSLRREKIVL